ncbi:hypothetical protein N5C36_12385 [Shewanella xiamenensis]|uniref:Uncharacterized protein n=1 Tax=Shewanella decolorationis TaxID=256839 RepID=A0A5B8R1U7_9GAMM|nr:MULTISPECIES: hypothetical protein [Shewanella]MDH1314879.1 hypothetical protein [Shewanella xiamenensis]QWY79390.1 hypothetical protein D0436_24755 [Shewanella decolorationis]
MATYIQQDDLSSFSIAADIHQNGGTVRVKNETELHLDFNGITINIRLVKGNINFISLSIQDVITPPANMSKSDVLGVLNEHCLALVPCAIPTISNSTNDGQYILTVRSDIASECGLIMEHFEFHVHRFSAFTNQLFAKLQSAGCTVMAQEMIELLKNSEAETHK